jgi:hypothetical protein
MNGFITGHLMNYRSSAYSTNFKIEHNEDIFDYADSTLSFNLYSYLILFRKLKLDIKYWFIFNSNKKNIDENWIENLFININKFEIGREINISVYYKINQHISGHVMGGQLTLGDFIIDRLPYPETPTLNPWFIFAGCEFKI